ncbi:MAG TPA: CDGSH iron-sulfur domain-containing protein [Rhizomicrobium sp.]|jgi:CDGSH-type Zn-finger protein/uncharacterized Fe-S cluster protein YjdI|nr:CDGSH iron-sulfur domain-containing protein [Rhizomicrobium sp.]
MSDVETYPGQHLAILSDGKRCIHSRYCVLNLPNVFVPNVEGPWIHPDAASLEAGIAVITKCPSGALSYEPVGDTPAEGAPGVNTVRVWEDGPLAFHAELSVGADAAHRRATLCRCGMSKNKPYCDHSHVAAKFRATGEPESRESDALAVRGGPLKVTPQTNGPLMVEGALEICAASGRTVSRETKVWLCRCGHSQDKPFCDGSHKAAGFIG